MNIQKNPSQEIEINIEDITKTLDHIQESLFDSRVSTNDDIISLMLEANEEKPFGINRKMLSIVRRSYGNNHLTIVADKGKLTAGNDSAKLSDALEKIIEKTIDGQLKRSYLNNEANDKSANPSYFLNNSYQSSDENALDYKYKHILIVPMRLYQDKSIGAFVIGSPDETTSFTHHFSETLDSASNRLALCLRVVDKNHRERLQNSLNHALDEHNASRFGAVKCCVDYLTKDLHTLNEKAFPKNTQPWFHENEFDILVRSPQYFEKFFWMYGDGKIQIDKSQSDTTKSLELNDLKKIAGNKSKKNDFGFEMPSSLIKVFKSNIPLILNTRDQCKRYFASHDEESIPQSCAIIPMKIKKDKSIGYFIFKNFKEKRAYEFESFLLDDISDKLASIFVNIRHKERSENLVKFREIFHQKSQAYNEEKHYIEQLRSILNDIYGESIDFSLLIRNKKTGRVEERQTSENFLSNFSGGMERVLKLARAFILSQTNDKVSYTKDFIDRNNDKKIKKNSNTSEDILELVSIDEEAKYLTGFKKSAIFPLHRVPAKELSFDIEEVEADEKEDVNVGCLIIKGTHLGSSDLKFIDSLTNQLALKLHQLNDRKRQEQLYEFDTAIQLTENITLERLLELIHKYTDKVMFTEHMFIAMLKDDTSIKFPLYFEGGTLSPTTAQSAEENRFFDLKSTKKGRVEVILESGQAIYIKNLDESQKWYNQEDREEKIGNPYASWIGVPIWDKKIAIGVIAIYHPTENFMYEKGDLNFLVEIAGKASGLLRELKLEEANKQLEEANKQLEEANKQLEEAKKNIFLKESRLLKASFAKDLTHKMNNKIGGALSQLGIAKEITETVASSVNSIDLEDAIEAINFSSDELTSYLLDLEKIDSPKRENFILENIIKTHYKNIKMEKKIDQAEMIIKNPEKNIEIFHYKILIDSLLHTFINNSAESIKTSAIKLPKKGYYIKTELTQENNSTIIQISDNGERIPESIANKLFKQEISTKGENHGYGLNRAKEILDALGGSVSLSNNSSELKTFKIKIPTSTQIQKKCIIVDDERVWRKTLNYYMKKMGYSTYIAENTEDATEILKENKGEISLSFIDLSFNENIAGDVQGLSLIKEVKKTSPNSKIIIVSGKKEKAQAYSDEVDLILDKVKEGKPITFDTLKSEIENI